MVLSDRFLPAANSSARSKPLVMVCFGTRPEVVKLAPVIEQLDADPMLDVIAVTTAQHREMLDQTLATFGLVPDIDLGLMKPSQKLSDLTAVAVSQLGAVMEQYRPDAVLVQGDTTTVFCASLAAFYNDIPVGHVEAGLRTDDRRNPFPEEINRRLVGNLAQWHFCPTERNAERLRREGIPGADVLVTGNTVIDALLQVAERPLSPSERMQLPPKAAPHRILVTLHRRETQGEAQRRLCSMLAGVADRPDVEVLFPVHLSPAVRASVMPELDDHPSVHLTDPLGYASFVHAMKSSHIIVTDSGGVQEEAPVFGIPVLVLRETTERQEGVDAGCCRLSGTDPADVQSDLTALLDHELEYQRMSRAVNPYGDGKASDRILTQLRIDLTGSDESWESFVPAELGEEVA